MPFLYQAYGLSIVSSVELPALVSSSTIVGQPLHVELGKVPETFENPPTHDWPFSTFNAQEFRYEQPKIGKYFVSHGFKILIEPISTNTEKVLLYFYANCLAIALLQRNLIPFHVSGVGIGTDKVLLFAAPSQTGKSTTALKLQELGYAPFTDDTALLQMQEETCVAVPSYPMARLWQKTIGQQRIFDEADKQIIFSDIDKYGFSFHEQFSTQKPTVAGLVFLEESGDEIEVQNLSPMQALPALYRNIYRREWLVAMGREALMFRHLTSVVQRVPCWKAVRPANKNTFESFAKAIESQIIRPTFLSKSSLAKDHKPLVNL
ncbi:hypothetical protein [Arundinibacter roseus]|uniref:Serine kinase n=1 Tax=Arundinibacter roseus TaxID=2070510 RepID=A0A4R4K358_9BACT|nr:hypothetical protein [Arundinibacter roseus]TDB61797.1 hypothetical protein EZE20_18805 [Arundinibacter roseus]